MSNTKPMPVKLLEWRAMERNTLRGFARVSVGALEITDVTVHVSGDRRWASLPAKPQIDKEGGVIKKDGKTQYAKVIAWLNKETQDRFSEAVIAAIEETHGPIG